MNDRRKVKKEADGQEAQVLKEKEHDADERQKGSEARG